MDGSGRKHAQGFGGCRQPGLGLGGPGRVTRDGQGKKITGPGAVVEDQGPVGEEQSGVGRVGLVGVGAPGLRLQLVAQIADIAKVELEGQAFRCGHLPGAQLFVEVIEERLPDPLWVPSGRRTVTSRSATL